MEAIRFPHLPTALTDALDRLDSLQSNPVWPRNCPDYWPHEASLSTFAATHFHIMDMETDNEPS